MIDSCKFGKLSGRILPILSMTSNSSQKSLSWYVLNYISSSYRDVAQKAINRFNSINGTELELFAPTYVIKEERQGELKFRTVNLTFHYVFVRGCFDDVKRLCIQPNGFSFLVDRAKEDRYAVIDDRSMSNFKNIASAYKNCLPYFPLDDIDLEEGDLVEVVKGDFPGLIGTYMPNAKSKTGNIVLHIFNNVGTIAFDVKATDVRVLEFSKNYTRANDQIDAFVPNLLKALRYYDQKEALPSSLAAKLSVFCGRLGVARINNRKLDAKLQILLYASNHIIGNSPEADIALTKFQRIADSVTNEWTKGLINLIRSVITNDTNTLTHCFERLKALDGTSKMSQMIFNEYSYYIQAKSYTL